MDSCKDAALGVAIVVGPRLSFRGEDDGVAVRIGGEHVVQRDGEDRDGEGDCGHASCQGSPTFPRDGEPLLSSIAVTLGTCCDGWWFAVATRR